MPKEIDPEFLEIVTCRKCGKHEYWGMMISAPDGHTYCRACTLDRWERDSLTGWKRRPDDKVYPLYEDGVDYRPDSIKDLEDDKPKVSIFDWIKSKITGGAKK